MPACMLWVRSRCTLYPTRGTGDHEITIEVSVTSVLKWGAFPMGGSASTHSTVIWWVNFPVTSILYDFGATFTLTGDKLSGFSFTQNVVLLCMQCGRVLRVGLQVEQGVLSEAGGQAQLCRAGALHGEEEPVACNFCTRGKPNHHSSVLGDVGEVDVCGSVRLWGERDAETRSNQTWAMFKKKSCDVVMLVTWPDFHVTDSCTHLWFVPQWVEDFPLRCGCCRCWSDTAFQAPSVTLQCRSSGWWAESSLSPEGLTHPGAPRLPDNLRHLQPALTRSGRFSYLRSHKTADLLVTPLPLWKETESIKM